MLSLVSVLDHVQVDTPLFVICMVTAFVATIWGAVRLRRAQWLTVRYGLRGAVFVMFLLTGLAWANAYFAYIPTLGEVLGRKATYQASHATLVRRLATARVLAAGQVGTSASFPLSGPARGHPLSGSVSFVSSVGPAALAPTLPAHGLVELVNIPGTLSGFHARAAEVYLPPAWFDPIRPALPVVMLLQGTPGTPADWTRGGEADVTVDAWAAAHHGVAPILVMPDPNGGPFADTECVDGRQGAAETYLTRDVRSFVIRTYAAATDRDSWAIGGLSEGGQCAITLTLRHPDLFSAFLAFGADDHLSHDGGLTALFRGSGSSAWMQAEQYAPRHLLAIPPVLPVSGWFGAGQADGGLTAGASRMYWLATRSGIDAHLEIIPGAHHTFRVWRDAFAAALPWLSARLTPVVYPPPARLLGPPVTWRYVRHVRTREDQDSAPLAAGLPLHVTLPSREELINPDENPLGRSRG